MPESFYVPLAPNLFASTKHTRGPWGPEYQHGGPPASLLGRAIERVNDRTDASVARVTFEILRPVPVSELRVTTDLVRPGRKVEMVEASLWAGETEVMKARAWRVRTTELDLPEPDRAPLEPPSAGIPTEPLPTEYEFYLHAMEARSLHGGFTEPGPATTWFRMRHPLLPDEPVSPLTRVLIAADSASGISGVLDWREWIFINTDLTVQLHRMPVGEWVCLDADTTIERNGVGVAASRVHDEMGPVGQTLQTLYVARREDG